MSENLEDLLSYMPEIEGYKGQLVTLDDAWETIKLITEVSCPMEAETILPSMTSTQHGFQDLQKRLVDTLIVESLKKQIREMTSRAQVAIDILIRNLFERTADVGFLATDEDIRKFLLSEENDDKRKQFMNQRLLEYVKKYSVYDEIVLLDRNLKVKAHLDPSNPIADLTIDEPILQQALRSQEPFLEYFGRSRLQPERSQALIYVCKITESASSQSQTIGVLALCFRFTNEMEGIFRGLTNPDQASVISILNSERQVIASSDTFHLPLGAQMETSSNEEYHILNFRGIEYLVTSCATTGYQGYFGQGWHGQVMEPIGLAFRKRRVAKPASQESKMMDKVVSQSSSFSAALAESR